MWRQASLPAVEGGILPPGKTVHLSKRSHFTMTFPVATQFRRAGSPGSTSAKMADATIFRQALKSNKTNHQKRQDHQAGFSDRTRLIFWIGFIFLVRFVAWWLNLIWRQRVVAFHHGVRL
jgi:hypothetical protein